MSAKLNLTIVCRNAAERDALRDMLANGITPEVPTNTRKAPAKADPKPTKGAQTRESLSRKDWNRTLTAKARFMGGSAYKTVIANWETAQQMRDSGVTPDEALASLTK